MTVRSLKSLMDEQSSSFLLLDVRPSGDYLASHVKTPQSINIPEEILSKRLVSMQFNTEDASYLLLNMIMSYMKCIFTKLFSSLISIMTASYFMVLDMYKVLNDYVINLHIA